MIEADIILGTTPNNPSDKRIPVMGHPPSELSDLSFEEFFQTVEDYNRKGNVQRKGIKLDYKSIDAYQKSVQTILGSYHKVTLSAARVQHHTLSQFRFSQSIVINLEDFK